MNILNKHLKIVQQYCPVKNILGIFKLEDNISEAIIIPLFETICTSTEVIDKTLETADGGIIYLFDIRKAYQATKLGHPELINILYTDYKIINPLYSHLFEKLAMRNRDNISAGISSEIPASELKTAIVKICRTAWNDSSNVVKFIKQLTDVEKLALEGIVKKIGDEGTISQAKIASEVGVSRLTMSNLIMKMKFHDVANIDYLGNKGTYIKIIDDTLLNIRGV